MAVPVLVSVHVVCGLVYNSMASKSRLLTHDSHDAWGQLTTVVRNHQLFKTSQVEKKIFFQKKKCGS